MQSEPEEDANQHRNMFLMGVDNTLYASIKDELSNRYKWISLSYR